MINYSRAIQRLFPGAAQGKDFEVIEEGKGAFIAYWNIPSPQPNQTDLQMASDAWQADQDKINFNAPILAQLAANDAKIVRALTEGDTTRINSHKTTQAALRAQLKA